MLCYMVRFGMFCIYFPDDLTWVSDFSGRSEAPNSLKGWGMRDLSPWSWDMLRCNGVILCYFDSREENDDTTVIGILQCCNHHRLNACLQQWWGVNQRHSDIVGILAAAFGRAHHQNGSCCRELLRGPMKLWILERSQPGSHTQHGKTYRMFFSISYSCGPRKA